jgi:ubiquitin C
MRIFFKTLIGKKTTLEVEASDCIDYIKRKIHGLEGLLPDRHRLKFARKRRESGRIFSDYNILEEHTLQLGVRLRERFQLLVRLPDGRAITVEIQTSDTIRTLKSKIEDKEGIPSDEQILIAGGPGVRFRDEQTISDCNLVKDTTLRLIHVKPGPYNHMRIGASPVLQFCDPKKLWAPSSFEREVEYRERKLMPTEHNIGQIRPEEEDISVFSVGGNTSPRLRGQQTPNFGQNDPPRANIAVASIISSSPMPHALTEEKKSNVTKCRKIDCSKTFPTQNDYK